MMKNNYNITECKSARLSEKYYKIEHESGLDVYVFPKKLTTTYALFGTNYGSIDSTFKLESDERFTTVPDGIAHFLEHKLFTNEDGSDSFERFSEYGGDANAYTSFDKTVYLFSCTDRFRENMTELLQFVTHPYFTDESVAKEQGIIAQEIRMCRDNPYDRCFLGLLESMYKKHSVRRDIAGSIESIGEITPEILYECYRVFYRLSNMALVVCGDVTVDEVMELVDENIPASAENAEIIRESFDDEPCEVYKKRYLKKMQVGKPIYNIGFKDTNAGNTPSERMRKEAAMTILDEMLFSRSGEFYNDLFERGIISPSYSYGFSQSKSFAFNSVAGEANDPETVYSEFCKYIEKVKTEGLSRADFERCKKVTYAEYIKEFDSTSDISNILLSFVFDGADVFEYAEIIDAITFEEVSALLATEFDESRMTMSVIMPLDAKQ